MFEPYFKVLGALGLVIGLVTGFGTIVGWIVSDSFGDTVLTALWLAGILFAIAACVLGAVEVAKALRGPLMIRIAFGLVAGILLLLGIGTFWSSSLLGGSWFFVGLGCTALLSGASFGADWALDEYDVYKKSRIECPDCAETVKSRARVCRCCGYRFQPAPDVPLAQARP
jgi:hypothetical protein